MSKASRQQRFAQALAASLEGREQREGGLDLGGGLDLDLGGAGLDLESGSELDLGGPEPEPPPQPIQCVKCWRTFPGETIEAELRAHDAECSGGGTQEERHAAQTSELKTAFMQRAAADKDRFLEATDSEFWFCVCFRTREQKEAFLSAVQWPGITPDDKYVHGEDIAKALDVPLPPARWVPPGEKPNKDMVRLGLIGDE